MTAQRKGSPWNSLEYSPCDNLNKSDHPSDHDDYGDDDYDDCDDDDERWVLQVQCFSKKRVCTFGYEVYTLGY